MQGFKTERLTTEDWTPHLGNKARRLSLEARLAEVLTPAVTAHLPEPLQLAHARDVSGWIDARQAEAQVLLVKETTGETIGLVILARLNGDPPDIHIGYLFAEEVWGQGLATEMLHGLVGALPRPARLLAGVEEDNAASIRVLEKVGFRRGTDDTLFHLPLA